MSDTDGGPECPYCQGTGVITYAELDRLRECERDRDKLGLVLAAARMAYSCLLAERLDDAESMLETALQAEQSANGEQL